MKSTFSYMVILLIALILITGISVHWLTTEDIKRSKQETTQAIADGVAIGLAAKIELIIGTLDKMAADRTLLTAIKNQDSAKQQQILNYFTTLLPGALKLKLLTPENNSLDLNSVPSFGYADMSLVQETFENNRMPVIQGEKGANRHLAIARKTPSANQIKAVLFASLNYAFLNRTVQAAHLSEGLIQLKQGKLVLAQSGQSKYASIDNDNLITIAGTQWVLQWWPTDEVNLDSEHMIPAILGIIMLIALLGFYYAYRYIESILVQDQTSILLALKDMTEGDLHGTYPAILDETKTIIATARQYKRVMDKKDTAFEKEDTKTVDDAELDDLFNEMPENPDLETASDNNDSQKAEFEIFDPETNTPIKVSTSEKPILMPEEDTLALDDVGVPNILFGTNRTHNGIYKAYDIRGIVGTELNQQIVKDIGCVIGGMLRDKKLMTLIVGRDGRLSSPELSASFITGVLSTGVNVINLGITTSPVLYFVSKHHKDHSGVMITGSHNPAEYNGLKIIIDSMTLYGKAIQQIAEKVQETNYVIADTHGTETDNSLFQNEYIGAICEQLHLARPMKVVVDCGNGAAGEIAPTLLKTLGCDIVELFCDIDGNFPNHHPDPGKSENLEDLKAAVKYYDADLGLAFDGDGDRLGVVDEKGKIIWPDRQMMLYAEDVLSRHTGATILYDVKCTSLLEKTITQLGGQAIMSQSGHSIMKAKLKEHNAKLAGEMSGHFIFNDKWFDFDDALYSACRICEILSADSRKVSEIFDDFPDNINTPELNVPIIEGEGEDIINKLIEQAEATLKDAKFTKIDGLRIDYPDAWALVRVSNTTPSLSMRFEAENKTKLEEIQKQIKSILFTIKAELQLPF